MSNPRRIQPYKTFFLLNLYLLTFSTSIGQDFADYNKICAKRPAGQNFVFNQLGGLCFTHKRKSFLWYQSLKVIFLGAGISFAIFLLFQKYLSLFSLALPVSVSLSQSLYISRFLSLSFSSSLCNFLFSPFLISIIILLFTSPFPSFLISLFGPPPPPPWMKMEYSII